MKGNRAVLTAVVVLVVIGVGWWLFGRGGAGTRRIDLLDRFEAAEKRPPEPKLYSVSDVTLAGVTKRAIAIQPTAGTRLVFKVRVPDDGWLWVSLGMHPDSWTKEGDGVKFLVGVSDGRAFEEIFSQHVHPVANEGDRKWQDARVDLSTYAGEEIELILNTYASVPGAPYDMRNDLPLWGSPEIVVR
jgi:hypothetical protein